MDSKKKLWPNWKQWLNLPKAKESEQQARKDVDRARRAHFEQLARRHG